MKLLQIFEPHDIFIKGALWLSGRVLDSRPRGRGSEPHRRHCVVSLSKNINSSLVLVQPRKTRPFITEKLLMGRKESNQTKYFDQILYTNSKTNSQHYLTTNIRAAHYFTGMQNDDKA